MICGLYARIAQDSHYLSDEQSRDQQRELPLMPRLQYLPWRAMLRNDAADQHIGIHNSAHYACSRTALTAAATSAST